MQFVSFDSQFGKVNVIFDDFVTVSINSLEFDLDEDNNIYIKGMENYTFKNGNKLDLRLRNWNDEFFEWIEG